MRRGFRIAIALALVIGLVLSVKVLFAFRRFSEVERQFDSIQRGDAREFVIARLGKPNYYAGKCGVIHFPDRSCALEYVYSHPFAPLVPEYYIVSFSADGRVIAADTWMSP